MHAHHVDHKHWMNSISIKQIIFECVTRERHSKQRTNEHAGQGCKMCNKTYTTPRARPRIKSSIDAVFTPNNKHRSALAVVCVYFMRPFVGRWHLSNNVVVLVVECCICEISQAVWIKARDRHQVQLQNLASDTNNNFWANKLQHKHNSHACH